MPVWHIYRSMTLVFQRLQAWQDSLDGLDDQALADKIGVHRTTISRAKRGVRALSMGKQLLLQKHTKISPAEWAEFYAQTVHLRGEGASRPGEKGAGNKAGRPFAASAKAPAEAA